jgi:hypothetical protein
MLCVSAFCGSTQRVQRRCSQACWARDTAMVETTRHKSDLLCCALLEEGACRVYFSRLVTRLRRVRTVVLILP